MGSIHLIEKKVQDSIQEFPNSYSFTPQFVELLTAIIMVVDKINLTGNSKKKLVIDVMFNIINKCHIDMEIKNKWIFFLKKNLPEVIDHLIQFSKKVNKKKQRNSFCCF